MYATTLSRSLRLSTKFGIVGWDDWSQTRNALSVMPGQAATLAKPGAMGLGERLSSGPIA